MATDGDAPTEMLELLEVLDLDGRAAEGTDPGLDIGLVKRIYEAMVRSRLIDLRLTRLQRQGRVGFHVGAEGEEGRRNVGSLS